MAEPAFERLAKLRVPPASAIHPEVVDETVVHDASGRPWLVCTSDMLFGLDDTGPGYVEELTRQVGQFETQVHYTARGGIRGLPTGHGQRYLARKEAVVGHRRWCLLIRSGMVEPDRVPDDPF